VAGKSLTSQAHVSSAEPVTFVDVMLIPDEGALRLEGAVANI